MFLYTVTTLKSDWKTTLRMALLGIRTTVKQDFHHMPSELVYATTRLQILGKFFQLLQAPYDGSYELLICNKKHFMLNIRDTKKVVSVD